MEPPGCRIANTENEDFLSNFTESSEKMELNFQIERRERERDEVLLHHHREKTVPTLSLHREVPPATFISAQ